MLVRDLKSLITTVAPALAGSTLPICDSIHFDEDRVWATNLEATIEIVADLGVTASIPHKAMKALLSSLDPKQEIRLGSKDGDLEVRTDAGATTLTGSSIEDRPDVRVGEAASATVKIEAGFKRSIEAVAVACSTDQSRPVLTGVLVELDGDGVALTATDSYRLHHDQLAASVEGRASAIVPPSYIKALAGDAPVMVEITTGHVRVIEGPRSLTLRVMDGEFPNYRQLRPAATHHQVTFADEAGEVDKVLKTFERLSDRFGGGAPIVLDLHDDGLVRASVSLVDVGEHHADLAVKSCTGEGLRIAFNPRYLRAAVGFSGGEIEIVDPLKPAVLADSACDGRYALLMPVRLS